MVLGLQTRNPDTSKQLATVVKESGGVSDVVDTEKVVFPLKESCTGVGLDWLIGSRFYLLAPCDLCLGLPFRHSESLNSKPGSWQVVAWSDLGGRCIGMHRLKMH